MKKTLLIAMLSVPFLLFAQEPVKELKVTNNPAVSVSDQTTAIDNETSGEQTVGSTSLKNKVQNYDFILLGESYYDLQTNSSPGRRVVLHSDGTVSAVWTASPDDGSGWPNRGSGYNYFDGSDWLGVQSSRIESTTRTGWPSISLLSNGGEVIIAHESNTGGFIMSTNGTKGSTSWTSTSAILDDLSENGVNRVPIWNRSATGGDYIHLISNYWFSDAAGVPLVTRNGVTSPTTYSRSSDNGATWSVQHMLLPGYDSTLYPNGGGDNYAIDVRDSVVAIVMGGLGEPVSLWKSMDNGDNFTYIDVDMFPYKGRGDTVLMLDTPETNDGSLDVILDASGNAHVFYGGSSVLDDDLSDDGAFSFFPGTSRMMHWTEGMAAPQICGGSIDMDFDNTLTINQETFSTLDANGLVPSGLLSAARTGNTSIVTMPSASIDANGNIFVVYSAAIETTTHFLNGNFRDILVSYSDDGGTTWYGPQNITQNRFAECSFPNVSKTSDDNLHLIWQEDAYPGTHLQNHDAVAGSHPNEQCKIQYAAIPISEIMAGNIGQNTLGEEKLDRAAEVMVVSQNQPNPFTGTSQATIYLVTGTNLTVTITDVLGNVVKEENLGVLNAGNHNITLDGNGLSTGMYFYTLSTDDVSVTKKMQVN